jgi:hypothetical protein
LIGDEGRFPDRGLITGAIEARDRAEQRIHAEHGSIGHDMQVMQVKRSRNPPRAGHEQGIVSPRRFGVAWGSGFHAMVNH